MGADPVDATGLRTQPCAIAGRRHPPTRMRSDGKITRSGLAISLPASRRPSPRGDIPPRLGTAGYWLFRDQVWIEALAQSGTSHGTHPAPRLR